MSLVGFKARNHPQQKANPKVDDRATPPEVFDPLHERFAFTIDVAASVRNAKLSRFYSSEDDGLAQSWAGERVWCNPPYSSIEPWLQKAWYEWDHYTEDGSMLIPRRADLIVMLLPANRTEQPWWQRHVEPFRDRLSHGLRTHFIAGRTRFIAHDADGIRPNERPPFGCVLLIWGDA